MADNTQTQNDPRITLQGLLGLLQPTPNPQSANAALGQGTTNILNNAAQFTGNQNIAAGNYDATQNSGIGQQQLAKILQNLGQGGANISNQPQQQDGGVSVLGQSQPSPYQKGVQKALTESGYKHANEALAAGMPADQIANHPAAGGGQQQGQTDPNAMATLQQLIQQSQQQPTDMQNMQKQSANLVAQPKNVLQGLLQGFAQGTGYTGQRLENISKAQQNSAGQPGQIALPSAQAAQTNAQAEYQRLQNSGNKPIDPEQYLNAYSNMYQKAYDAYSKDEEAGAQMSKDALEQYNSLAEKARGPFSKFTGGQSKQMQSTLQAATASLKASIDARTNFHSFMLQNSPSQVIGNIKNKVSSNPQTNDTSSGSGINIGDKFNGEKVINVKRIK